MTNKTLRNILFYSHTPKRSSPHETGQFEKKIFFILKQKALLVWHKKRKNRKVNVIAEIKTFIFSSEKQIPQKTKLIL